MVKRKCSKCEESKDLNGDNFPKDKSRTCGFMYTCKPCEKIRTKERYLKNPRTGRYSNFTDEEKAKKYAISKIYNKTPKGRAIGIMSKYAQFDRERGYETDLTIQHLIDVLDLECVYCSYPATGYDRLNNKKGHTILNSVPCCKECNTARMDNFTHEETKIIGKAIKIIKDNRKINLK